MKSCWMYCSHTPALERISMRMRGYGSFVVGLPENHIQVFQFVGVRDRERKGRELYSPVQRAWEKCMHVV